MAAPHKFFIFSLSLISCHFITTIHGGFSKQSHIILPREKLTHLHFFFHEILEGENPTTMRIIDPPINSPDGFGSTFMMDVPLTEGLELSSKFVGRAQGMFSLVYPEEHVLVMLINFVFIEGEYAGSTLSMHGRNPVQNDIREMAIVGGTGVFKFAKGYVIAKSLWDISSTKHFVIEYNITVSHP